MIEQYEFDILMLSRADLGSVILGGVDFTLWLTAFI